MSSLSTPVSFLSAGSEVWPLAGCACVCVCAPRCLRGFVYFVICVCTHAGNHLFYVSADVWMID